MASSAATRVLNHSATEQRLINEVFLIKAAFCRVSRRIRLIENFLKSTFDRQFPLRSKKSSVFSTEFAEKVFSSNGGSNKKGRRTGLTGPKKRRDVFTSQEPNLNGTSFENENGSDEQVQSFKTDGTTVSVDPEHLFPCTDVNVGELVTLPTSETQDDDTFADGDNVNDIGMEEPVSPDDVPSPSVLNSDSDEDNIPSGDMKLVKRETDPNYESTAFCELCGKHFTAGNPIRALREHKQRFHTTVKNHKCSICDKTFATKTLKNIHEKSHLAKKPKDPGPGFKCTICGRVLKGPYRYLLKQHMLNMHPTTEELKYKCSICDRTFAMLKAKNRHEKYHTVRFTCEFCAASYTEERGLKRHLHKREKNPDGTCPPTTRTTEKTP